MFEELISGMASLFYAFLSGDSFSIYEVIWHWSAYPFFATVMVVSVSVLLFVVRRVPFLDNQLERSVLILTYIVIAMVIFIEVIRRFIFQLQAPWSTTLPPYLFLIMSWVGCAYNAKLRTHLSFDEFRMRLPRLGQFFCLLLDSILWLLFSLIIVVTAMRQTVNSASNFQILLGTDDVMQWWFYVCVPISWIILSMRVVENSIEDYNKLRSGSALIENKSFLGD